MEIVENRVYLGGVEAISLAGEFGTPLFVIEVDAIRAHFRELTRLISYRPLVVHYALKANPNLHILKVLKEEGAHIDACSPGDVYLALKVGFTPDQIFYTGYAVSDEELSYLTATNVFVNIDSLGQLEKYGRLRPGTRIGLRINPGITAGFHSHVASGSPTSKFGLHVEQLEEAKRLAKRHDLTVSCLHLHIGSDILEAAPYRRALNLLLNLANQFDSLESLDLGGGWGVPYEPQETQFDWATYGQELSGALTELSTALRRSITLRIEPGTYLVGDAVHLLTRVVDTKPSVLRYNGERTPIFVGTDTSLNHLIATVIYQAYHEIVVADRPCEPGVCQVHVCGNLMQAGDVLAVDRVLPRIREGDLLIFKTAGAYTSCRASRFNERPLPAEVVVANSKVKLARRRESLEDLASGYIL